MSRTYRTDDPVADAERYAAQEDTAPVCEKCGEYITTPTLFKVRHFIYCHDCIADCEEPTDWY